MTRPWARVLLGAACVVVGVVLTLRPFTSLEALVLFVTGAFFVTGVSELVAARDAAIPALAVAAGLGWIAAGVAALVWAASTIQALAIVVGISMLLGGLTRVIAAIRGRADDRLIVALGGAASVIFGLLALSWPDKTVLILALLVGPSTVIFGLGQFLAVWRQHLGRQPAVPRWGQPRWLRAAGAVAVVIFALVPVAVSAAIHRSTASPDAFYTPPSTIPARPECSCGASATPAAFPRSGARGESSTPPRSTRTFPQLQADW